MGAPLASGQTWNVDLQAGVAVQMWTQAASVMVYPPGVRVRRVLSLTTPLPPAGGRSCSIPAGPALFISSQAAMINEALNTSSLSPGPAEPHSWVNRPELLFHPAAVILDLRWADGGTTPPLLQVDVREIRQLGYHIHHVFDVFEVHQESRREDQLLLLWSLYFFVS